MGRIIIRSLQQPLARPAPRGNRYQAKDIDIGRVQSRFEGGPAPSSPAAGLTELARGLSIWVDILGPKPDQSPEPDEGQALKAKENK